MDLLDLYCFAEKEGIEIDYIPMKEIIAVSLPEGCIAMNINKIKTSAEEKVYLAHELGHCMTGSFYNIKSKFNLKSKCEARATRWAIKKLIPKTKLKKAFYLGLHETWELAEYFNVPEPFIKEAIEYYKTKEDDR